MMSVCLTLKHVTCLYTSQLAVEAKILSVGACRHLSLIDHSHDKRVPQDNKCSSQLLARGAHHRTGVEYHSNNLHQRQTSRLGNFEVS
jgi:hypothetical protein